MTIRRIADGLYIGSIADVRTEQTSQFDTVISVCQDTAEENVGCHYQHYNIADGREAQREWGGSVEFQVFQRAANYAVQSVEHGDTLIHCHRGQNRSAAVCTAVMGHYGHDFEQSLEIVNRMNPRTDLSPLMYVFARRYHRLRWQSKDLYR